MLPTSTVLFTFGLTSNAETLSLWRIASAIALTNFVSSSDPLNEYTFEFDPNKLEQFADSFV